MADTNKKTDKAKGAPELPKDVAKQLGSTPHESNTTPKEEKSAPEKPEQANPQLDDKKTDEAVEDIIRRESDELLEAQDAAAPELEAPEPPKPRWWRRAWFRWLLVLLLFVLIGLMTFPKTRYWIMNHVGVRVSASVVVVDNTTGQPLKNVDVTIGAAKGKTGSDGKAKINNIKLGEQQLKLERIAFASLERKVTLGLGSNPLGTYELEAVGAQYTLIVRDFLSNQPIKGAEASSGQAAALSDEEGKIVLTLEESDGSDVTATVGAKGYRSEKVTLKADTKEPNNVVLVPSAKEVFVSNESGKYDVYTIDVDGKNKKVLLPGTGLETGNITLAISPDGTQAALVSTRDNERNDAGLLNTLTLIDVASGDTRVLDRGEQIQIMDWIGDRVIYHMIANVAANSDSRQRIVSYDYKTNSRAQLASANEIRSAASAWGEVYYTADGKYFNINPDGNNQQTTLDKEVWTSYRTAYNELSLQTADGWYRLNLADGKTSEISEPSNYASRIFVTNGATQQSLWIDQNALQVYDIDKAKSTTVHAQDGLVYPVRWLTATAAVFRVANGQEVADYVISTQGGTAHKITDTTGTYGINPAF